MKKNPILTDKQLAGGFIVLSIIVMQFVFPMITLDPALYPRLLFLSVIMIIMLYFLTVRILKDPGVYDFSVFRRLIFPVYAAYFIISGLSVTVACNAPEAVTEWLKTGAFYVFLVIAVLILQKLEEPIVFLSRIVIIFSILIVVAGFVQFINIAIKGQLSHESTYLVRIPFGHRNLFSEILFLCLPFTGYGIYRFRGGWQLTGIITTLLLLCLITLLLTKSAWVAVILSSFVTIVTLANYFQIFEINKTCLVKILKYIVLCIVIIFSGMVIYSKFDSYVTLKKQTGWISNYRFGSSLERIDLWTKSMKMYRDHPVLGVGGGNWKIQLPKYGIEDIAAGDDTERGAGISQGKIIFQRPHNDFIWVLCETGFPGFILYAGIFIITLYYIFSFIIKRGTKEEKHFMLFMLSGLTGYSVIAMVSFPRERVDHSVFFHFIVAVTVFMYHRSAPDVNMSFKKTTVKVMSAMTCLVLLAVLLMSSDKVNSEIHSKKAIHYFNAGNWSAVISESEKAGSVFSTLDNTATPFMWYKGSGYYNTGQNDLALESFKTAYHYNPWHIHVLNNIATCYEIKGNHNEAEKYYKEALAIAPHFDDALINLSIVYFNTGKSDNAYQTINEVKLTSSNPNYHNVLDAILKDKIEKLIKTLTERDLIISVQRIYNSPEWFEKVYRQSVNDKNTYDRQILIEAVYLMENVDKSIKPEYAKQLRSKYHLLDKPVAVVF